MNKRVQWTVSETRLVMKEIVRQEIIGMTLPQPDKIIKCQHVLPEGRRRPVASAGYCCEFFKQLRQWENALRDEIKTEAAEPKKEVVPLAVALTPPPPEVDIQPEIIVVEKKVYVQPDYGRIPTPTLIRILNERMADMEVQLAALSKFKELTSEIETRRQNELQYDKRLDTRPTHQQPEHLPRPTRICVLGLLPTQQQEIEGGSYPKPVQFRFISKDRSDSNRHEVPSSVDHIILSRFISHATQDKILATVPREMVSYVEGGVTSIRQKVFDILSRQ